MIDPDAVAFDEAGLAPAVVQDARTGQVLMLAYMNREALEATLTTGEVHFWSRSRDELWHKGATSGNTMRVVDVAADCDGDSVLVTAEPAGPACHTGAATCFGDDRPQGFAALEGLWATITERAATRPAGSYTVELLDGGVDAVSRKVLEEAGEVLLAAKDHAAGGSGERVAEEAADLLYHLLVLMAERDLTPAGMLGALRARAPSSVT